MASGGSDQDAEYTLSKLLQMGTVAEYESEFVVLANRVRGISESLLTSFYISGLKLDLQCLLLRSNPKTLDEAFSLTRAAEKCFANLDIWEFLRSNPLTLGEDFFKARIIEARFEAIEEKEKEHIIEKKSDGVSDIGEGNVESMEVRSEFSEFSENKESVEDVVVGSGEAYRVDEDESNIVISLLKSGGGVSEINLGLIKEFVIKMFEGRDVSGESLVVSLKWVGATKDGRRVLCYVQGKGIRKKEKEKATIQRRLWDPGLRQCCRRTDCPNDSRSSNVWHKDYVI